MTPYEKHCQKWRDCKRCLLHERRQNVVFVRGALPCDVLFVGEAPGVSEDVLKRPFVGPAGKLLDSILQEGLREGTRYALTNLVGCIPKDKGNAKGEPPEEAVLACADKLKEMIALAKPQAIVCVGRLSAKHVPSVVKRRIEIIHPAAILRMDISQRGLAVQRCVVALRDLCEVLE